MRGTWLICALAGLAAGTAGAAQPADKSVDADLLEFLGSLDSEDDGWMDYLEQRPAKAAGKTPAKVPADAKEVKGK